MGYRSDVKAAFYATPDKAAAMKLFVDENFPEDLAGNLRPINNAYYQGYMFEDENVKWYDSYPEVIAFNRFVSNFLELAEQEEIKWCYEFVRVGEDTDDIEENLSNYAEYLVYPTRSIETDF
jgi:hypothetical protein